MNTSILIMAGGTGGHVFPALAVADELKSRQVDVSWMGTRRGIESRLVPEAGYPLFYINVQGLRGNGVLGWLMAPFKLIKALRETVSVINQVKPDVVIGMGGFASGPGGVAAWLMRKPLLIHEQNAIPGLTNKLLSRLASKVLEGFPNSFAVKTKAEWVGNPVRRSIEQLPTPEQRFADRSGPARILVLGGSLGARTLNRLMPAALAQIDEYERPIVIHQCGQRHLEDCEQAYQTAHVRAKVTDFIADMSEVYDWADLVICRAGALTVAELAAAGIGAILVPYPYAVDDHQTYNASMLVEAGAGVLIADKDLSENVIIEKIHALCADRQQLMTMAMAARSLAKTGTASQIADRCLELAYE